ncbi:hypothetical protein DWUX_449 [Desulfovibrio diazotrophicus]|nr:hypothetical protein DWUX_449 [Desulfovibrio diazotrophicus]
MLRACQRNGADALRPALLIVLAGLKVYAALVGMRRQKAV